MKRGTTFYPDDQIPTKYVTPGFKAFSIELSFNSLIEFVCILERDE